MNKETIFVLAVALITWGGVFAYLLRMNFLAKDIDNKLQNHDVKNHQ